MAAARKVFLALILLLVLAALGATGWFYWRMQRAAPQYAGELRLAGFKAPVTVLRDARGVPHVYAESLDDLLFAQGYLTAEERFWQMDGLRRTARGELAEVLGRRFLEMDKDNRTLGLGDAADRAFEQLDSEGRTQLETYAAGVNAYLETIAAACPSSSSSCAISPGHGRPLTAWRQRSIWPNCSRPPGPRSCSVPR